MLLVRNLRQIATPLGRGAVRGDAMRKLAVYDDAVIVVDGERIAYVGPERDNPHPIDEDFDAREATALPGFVDSHTHIPFAGFRESEFNRRLQGETYAEIAASGGGIASTVRHTRAASEEELAANIFARTATMVRYGTTTAEAKSGYGLNVEDELKQLRAIRRVSDRSPVRLVPTCLAAHEFPPENRSASYVDEVIEKILPAVADEKLATFCDAFVEVNVFTREQGDAVLRAGAKLGMIPRLHADELSDTDGAALAAELGAASADHLMFVSDRGIEALASSDTVANLLPATSFFLMSEPYAPARELIERGAIV
ncbi:MAG TPA: imidazolonepropionase, partial [Thermoanaerobaculia bacterium]